MPGIKIELKRIGDISFKFKKGTLLLTMETNLHPGDIARLINLDRQDVPLYGFIATDQAEMDLRFDAVSAVTGEVIEDRSLYAPSLQPAGVGEEEP